MAQVKLAYWKSLHKDYHPELEWVHKAARDHEPSRPSRINGYLKYSESTYKSLELNCQNRWPDLDEFNQIGPDSTKRWKHFKLQYWFAKHIKRRVLNEFSGSPAVYKPCCYPTATNWQTIETKARVSTITIWTAILPPKITALFKQSRKTVLPVQHSSWKKNLWSGIRQCKRCWHPTWEPREASKGVFDLPSEPGKTP